ncbi:Von willebrand domain containing protein [Lasiodiplodia theobromae]|uniref:Von willebrand domain containing protein n=1 Tax=Lasiodiplodia theobromae TaxID=45133 RepID=UPI0015C35A2D|nr:Von willebrand domain containing protein [Lasiodiplodia theobromae]KAF4546322.1 Von willebrand domain containing protein [Lasiodiplodia theobromae]
MSIASRYGTPPDGYSESNSTVEEQGLEINVDVSFPVPITRLASRSHPISVTMGSTASTSLKDMNTETDLRKANATLSNRSAELKGDFILLISPKESISNTKVFMEPHPKYDDHSAIMVTISPQDFARNASPTDHSKCEILFVIDCSGSMEDKVNDLRTAMKVAIRSLPEGCFFNLCLFGSSHELLWKASKPSTQENSDEAFACSAQLTADKGGTELNSALQSVITSRTPNMETNVIVVTDGETWDTEEIHASVQEANREHGLLKDLENQTSWLHGMQHEGKNTVDDTKFQDIVKTEAESFGKTWSIVGKWTSFIALEKSGPKAHVKSLVHLYRAEALYLSGPSIAGNAVARRRTDAGGQSLWPISGFVNPNVCNPPQAFSGAVRSPFDHYGTAPLGWHEASRAAEGPVEVQGELIELISASAPAESPRIIPCCDYSIQDLRHKSLMPCQSTREFVMNPQTSGISVEDIVSAQRSTGCFVLHSTSLDTLLSAFDEKAVQEVKSRVENKSSDTKEPLLPTILTIVYIEMQFQEQQELLDLVIDRAKRWLEKALPEEIDELLEVVRGGFLGMAWRVQENELGKSTVLFT